MEKRKYLGSETQHSAGEGDAKKIELQSEVPAEAAGQLEYFGKYFGSRLNNDSDESRESSTSEDDLEDDPEDILSERCLVCNDLKYQRWSATKPKPHMDCVFWTLEELEESSRNGCQLCGVICDGVAKVVPTAKSLKDDGSNTIKHSIKSKYFTPTCSDKAVRSGFYEIEFFTLPGKLVLCLWGFLKYVSA
jgi:hypothetical protein